ncbi:hypothetical protein BTA30_17860 [Bacillus swezeyi]|uniref:Uncharacterized protein n=1 Tax=Bacillus swezeyi TaxID=1925020 RepID=A0A1R1RMU0_9BACI|nr:hypothetical protein BW143_06445 [Bacillus swezeyi]OMI27321.1 hypothetical protein BTA30_17860 [Bacillus swezeyi]
MIIIAFILYLVSIPLAWFMIRIGHQRVYTNIPPQISDIFYVFLPFCNTMIAFFFGVEIVKIMLFRGVDTRKFFRLPSKKEK